jgi:hypothetical protein
MEPVLSILQRLRNVREDIRQTRHMMAQNLEATNRMLDLVGTDQNLLVKISGFLQGVAGPHKPATWVPPGHFYSPIVDVEALQQRRDRVFDRSIRPEGIDLRDDEQRALLRRLKSHCDRLTFTAERQDGLRYHYENPNYSYGDALVWAGLLMELRPRRVVEIGSGYSSCLTLDVNELFLDGTLDVTFVEPYPDLLLSLMKPGDRERVRIVPAPVQDLDLAVIDRLEAGDVLFIDSTHVSKCGSDVNFELFTILPRLKSGVYIHFHDIFYPFEYPEHWFFQENRSWNEIYIMRAFLTGNRDYEIVFFNHFMHLCYPVETVSALPLLARNSGGGLWLRKR